MLSSKGYIGPASFLRPFDLAQHRLRHPKRSPVVGLTAFFESYWTHATASKTGHRQPLIRSRRCPVATARSIRQRANNSGNLFGIGELEDGRALPVLSGRS